MEEKLLGIYNLLYKTFGSQFWWPAKSSGTAKKFEISVGAILTQNTAWKNVEKAIENLRKEKLLNEKSILNIEEKKLASLIKPAGYYNQKARKLKAFANFLKENNFEKLERIPVEDARKLLLEVHGIGNETADSILLYALNKPVFVIDAYTKRIFARLMELKFKSYGEWQEFFHANLPHNTRLFNEYHALLVKLAKEFCRKEPLCNGCFISKKCSFFKRQEF